MTEKARDSIGLCRVLDKAGLTEDSLIVMQTEHADHRKTK
jgi:hypothetical protein